MDIPFWIQILGGLVALFTIVSLLYKGVKVFRKDYSSHIRKRNNFYSGDWHNEGDVLRMDKHYIDLKLTCHANRVNGYFGLRRLHTEDKWVNMDISGKRKWGSYNCQITYIRFGQQSTFGKVKLKRKGTLLKWITLKDPTDMMPKELLLFKTLPTII